MSPGAEKGKGRGGSSGAFTEVDEHAMREAIELARQGIEGVSPNPLVGAVVVRRGRVVGRGFHRRYGGPHAEVEAIRDAGEAARGATLYVTLEPCAHHGKTPPCSDAIIAAGIKRAIYASADPNPMTHGKGPKALRAAGVEVAAGLLRREAERLNRPFFHWIRTGRPWVLLKWAMSLDGRIATPGGESKWITGKDARSAGHRLRRRVDAIIAGTETLLHDDPLLTPRPARGRRPLRVILDRAGRLPLELRLLAPDDRSGPRLYVASPRVPPERLDAMSARGLETLVLPEKPDGLDLDYLLQELGERGVSQVLVEGGGELAGSLFARRQVDEIAAFLAPRLIGGREAPGPIGGPGSASLEEALSLDDLHVEAFGADILIQGVVRR